MFRVRMGSAEIVRSREGRGEIVVHGMSGDLAWFSEIIPEVSASFETQQSSMVEHEAPQVRMAGGVFTMEELVTCGVPKPPKDQDALWVVELTAPIGYHPDGHFTRLVSERSVGFLGVRHVALRAKGNWLAHMAEVGRVASYGVLVPALKVDAVFRASGAEVLEADDLAHLEVFLPERRDAMTILIAPGAGFDELDALVDSGAVEGELYHSRPAHGMAGCQRQAVFFGRRAAIAELAALPSVLAIQPARFGEACAFNTVASVSGAITLQVHEAGFGEEVVTGAGEVVAITDNGIDLGKEGDLHDDLAGRVTILPPRPVARRFRPWIASLKADPCPADGPMVDMGEPLGHGTHVAGLIAGNGISAGPARERRQGIAPGAHILFDAVGHRVRWRTDIPAPAPWPPPDYGNYGLAAGVAFERHLERAWHQGARIHNVSIAFHENGVSGYWGESLAVDRATWRHRELVVVAAAGNNGRGGVGGLKDPESGTVTTPGTAKNALTVGGCGLSHPPQDGQPMVMDSGTLKPLPPSLALDKLDPDLQAEVRRGPDARDGIPAFSGRGPAQGRIKPEIVAPSTMVLSTRTRAVAHGDLLEAEPSAQFKYCWKSGTSMAAAIVSGAVALLREHLRRYRSHPHPSSALIKALLVATADRLPGPFLKEERGLVNTVSGFGRLNVAASRGGDVLFDDEIDHAIGTGQVFRLRATPLDPSVRVGIFLAWRDAPSPAGGGALVNSLYLRCRRAGAPGWHNGDVTAYPVATNNVHAVRIEYGDVEIEVHGVAVNVGIAEHPDELKQDFALVVVNAASLEWVRGPGVVHGKKVGPGKAATAKKAQPKKKKAAPKTK